MTSRLVIVTGLPASGKTTLARAIARRYRVALLAKDTVKEGLLDVLGACDAAGSRRLSTASFAALFALAREAIASGADLVMEGNFRPQEHCAPLAALLAAATGVRCAQLLCRTPEALRRARLESRRTDPARHPGHRDAELARAGILEAPGTDQFIDIPGERLHVDGASRPSSTQALQMLDVWWRSGA